MSTAKLQTPFCRALHTSGTFHPILLFLAPLLYHRVTQSNQVFRYDIALAPFFLARVAFVCEHEGCLEACLSGAGGVPCV